MNDDPRVASARAFLRNLNLLLKFAQLYGFNHDRTTEQFDIAWEGLGAALPTEGETGLLLAVSGSQLLINGVPIEATPPERSFVRLFAAAGLASLQFSPHLTRNDLLSLVHAFAASGGKPEVLKDELKASLGESGRQAIRVNEIRFVAEDAALSEARSAAELTARTLGGEAEQIKEWLNDPKRLLQLIAAAEGAHREPSSPPAGATPTHAHPSTLQEGDLLALLRMLTRLGQQSGAPAKPSQIQQQLAELPAKAQSTLGQALASLAAAPAAEAETPMLLQLAEHLAIRFALERYQEGEVRVDAVREMIGRMSGEIESLHKLLAAHEEKMSRAGVKVKESHANILDQRFWASVPESGKRTVLISPEAWCIPSRNIRQYVEQLLDGADLDTARAILLNYARCINSSDPGARRKTAIGLSDLVDNYANTDKRLLDVAIRHLAQQLVQETEPELPSLLSTAFVRFSQEVMSRHYYSAVEQVLAGLRRVEQTQPALAPDLHSRIAVGDHLPDFIEEALRAPATLEDLIQVLRCLPGAASEQLVRRFRRCTQRQERDRVVELTRGLGPEGTNHLRETLRTRPPSEAAYTVGLLSLLDPRTLEELLPRVLQDWQRPYHDVVVRQLSAGGAPERSRLFLKLLDVLDPLVLPQALDEMGLTGDPATAPTLMRLAGGELPRSRSLYTRVKALEALARLGEPSAAPLLRDLLEDKHAWRWAQPREIRMAAAQALQKIDPDWLRSFLPGSGLSPAELALAPLNPDPNARGVRQRRYSRVPVPRALMAVAHSPQGEYHLAFKELSLSGGLATSDGSIQPGTEVSLDFRPGLRHVRATGVVRDLRPHGVSFEIVDMELEERTKLRRLLTRFQSQFA